jgi:hypothetical protein
VASAARKAAAVCRLLSTDLDDLLAEVMGLPVVDVSESRTAQPDIIDHI